MSQIDTNQIWLALGRFYDLFPDDERVYWRTFWDAFGDIVADLWGYTFQVDKVKSLFSAPAVFERRTVLAILANRRTSTFARFRVSNVKSQGSTWTLRATVDRQDRNFTTSDLARRGLVRIGVDLLPYSRVNVLAESVEGFVTDAVFTLDGQPPHDYGDDPNFNDDFAIDSLTMSLRVNHLAGSTTIDATGSGSVNPTGLLEIDGQRLPYSSVAIVGTKYVFTLAPSWQLPNVEVPHIEYALTAGTSLVVHRHSPDRWLQKAGRWECRGALVAALDNEPTWSASSPKVAHRHLVSGDLDVSASVSLPVWVDPVGLGDSRRVTARLLVSGKVYTAGYESRRTISGIEHVAIGGLSSAPTEVVVASLPTAAELRFIREGSSLQCLVDDQLIGQVTATGAHAQMELMIEDDSQSASRVSFDEVTRRAGGVVGNQRLEEHFFATALYPHTYDIDQRLTSADSLIDRPQTRVDDLQTIAEIVDDQVTVIRGQPTGEDPGIGDAGVLEIGGHKVIYDRVVKGTDVCEFRLRRKLDPDLFPIAAGTPFTVTTRLLAPAADFELPGDGTLRLKELPTRDRMWAPVATIDVGHLQDTYGRLLNLTSDISTPTYAQRLRGTWNSLMDGPSFRNIHAGIQLAMGLPTAREAGTVVAFGDTRDALDKLIKREAFILTADGELVHELNADLYPFIDWTVTLGQVVDKFQPLTNGVGLSDVVSDPLWYQKFPGLAELERYNSFGVFVAIEALSADASFEDALAFALRAKPTFTKLVMRWLLTSGDEDLSEELDDVAHAAHVPLLCEDVTFDEGPAPTDVYQILTLGAGHKLGQHKHLGGTWQWHARTLGGYRRQGPFTGRVAAASDIFEADDGGFEYVELDSSTGVTTAGSTTFVSAGPPVFAPTDVGKEIDLLPTGGAFVIAAYLSPTSVTLDHVPTTTATGVRWQLRTSGFEAGDVGKNINVGGVDYKILVFIDQYHVNVNHVFVADAEVEWEMRDYTTLDDEEYLGHIYALKCHIEADDAGRDDVEAREIVTVAVVG